MDWKTLLVLFSICYNVFSLSSKEPGRLSVHDSAWESSSDGQICTRPACILAASHLIKSMDQSADPCTDFYQFACGGFVAEEVIPDHRTSKSSDSFIQDKLNQKLRKIFEAESSATEPKVYEHVRNYYHSCMNKETIEKNSFNELKEMVTKIGGWPVLEGEKWNGTNFKWHELSIKASDEGMDANFISIAIITDRNDTTKRIIDIGQPGFGLSRQYLIKGFNDKVVKAYYNFMVHTAVFLGANEAVSKKEMKQVLEFESKLVELGQEQESNNIRNLSSLYNPMTVDVAQKLYPELSLIKYISRSLGVAVDEKEVVNIAVPKYIKDFQSYISMVPARVQANYLVWRVVHFAMSYLNDEALKIELTYKNVVIGETHEAPRWEKCVQFITRYDRYKEGNLVNAVGGMYARKHYSLDVKDVGIAKQMVENIRAEFKTMVDVLDWMDPNTKIRAHRKADQITPYVAYAKEILNDTLINEFYKDIDLRKDSFLKNIMRLKKFSSEYDAKEFRKPIDKRNWKRHGGAATLWAFYSNKENSIQISAGRLGGASFNADRPLYMNYGAIGFIIGHEITHGFDDDGSQMDEDGK